jgi:chemotaxis protein methyltransferase CheR
MRDAECTAFLQWALPQLGRHWPGYRKVRRLVCKRLGRRLRELGLADFDAYRHRLLEYKDEWAALDALCGIPISRFYRDRGVFDSLEREVLPALADAAAPRGTLDIWSAGCAGGEEPYTLAILWAVRLQERFPQLGLRIVATDNDEQVLERARAGLFSPSSLKELPHDLRVAGFEGVEGGWRVRERFRAIDFLRQDLREAMPQGPFDLILCRNVLFTYYAPPLRQQLAERIVARLRPGGALAVGIHESIPAEVRGLQPWPGLRAVYRRT